jgi:hypothetical protein
MNKFLEILYTHRENLPNIPFDSHLLKTSYMTDTMPGSLCTLIGLTLCRQGTVTLVGETETCPHLCNRKIWKEECGLAD